jgi:hypothetical protein
MTTSSNLRIHSENDYRLTGSMMKNFVGNLSHKMAGHSIYVLFSLDEYDTALVSGISLKDGEKIFRAETDRSALTKSRFFVKVNHAKGLVYFTDMEENEESIRFETRGNKIRYMNLLSSAI